LEINELNEDLSFSFNEIFSSEEIKDNVDIVLHVLFQKITRK